MDQDLREAEKHCSYRKLLSELLAIMMESLVKDMSEEVAGEFVQALAERQQVGVIMCRSERDESGDQFDFEIMHGSKIRYEVLQSDEILH